MDATHHVDEHVDDFVHGLLDSSTAAAVESHCVSCTGCAAALAAAHNRFDLLQAAPTEAAPESLIMATLLQIAFRRDRVLCRPRRVALAIGGALAASALILVGLQVYYANLRASPIDLVVLGQRELLAASKIALRVRVADLDAGRALPDVPVEVTLRGPKQPAIQLASFTTDRHGSGSPRFELPDWADGDYELTVTAETPGGRERLSRPVRLKRSWQVMLSSDKPVYQPGQTIRLRALALRRPDLRPVSATPAVFTVTDPHGNVIFKKSEPTGRFGIAATDCPLAQEILEGAYTIACKVGDSDSRLTLEVKRYVLPKFKVDVTFDRPFYSTTELVKLTVKASYFFGKPVADAAVEVEVRQQGAAAKLPKLTGRTDATGAVELMDALPPQTGTDPNRFAFDVCVTDSAGQKGTCTGERVVSSKPVRIDVLPEGGRLVCGVPNRIYVLLSRADDQPQPGRVAIAGLGERATDDLGLAVFTFPSPREDVTLSVSARALNGEFLDQREVNLFSGSSPLDFLLTTDRAVYRGGDTLRLAAMGAGSEPVFVDFLKDGQTLVSETVEMSAGCGEFAFDLPPELTGPIEINAYRLGVNEPAVYKYRVVYVRRTEAVVVKVETDRAEYRPGDKASLRVRLRDRKDRPIAGAVSLAAVDEAVFRVGRGPAQIDPDEQSPLLRPIYAAFPWSPDMKLSGTRQERARFELALFARTAAEDRGAGRDALLRDILPFVENDASAFRVLERPNWEQLTDLSWLPKGVIEVLNDTASTHGLNASSYREKLSAVASRKRAALQVLSTVVGCAFGALVIVVGIGTVIIALRKSPEVILALVAIGVVLAAILPPVQRVREAAMRTSAANDLKQIGLAIANYQTAYGTLPGKVSTPAPVRLRERFPETLLWRPEIITDDAGNASLDIDLADSITTWRLTGSAVTGDGQLGAVETSIRVFQPFFVDLNLPAALTRGDEVAVPVVVSSYLDRPQRVTLALAGGTWFELGGNAERHLDLGPHEVRSVEYRLRAKKAGTHEFLVTARAGGLADAVKRTIEILPGGRRVEQVVNGSLARPADVPLAVPGDAIDGSLKAVVKIYPSGFSQLVEGLDGIFRLPSGCFEQTSSTTYPNVLALDYLRRTGRSVPAVEAKARQFIHLGYQRLVGFEVTGGGFDWFGRPPANRVLTAYGLMEFVDMARVHDVDPRLIERTRRWLFDQRKGDGSWDPESHRVDDAAGIPNDRLAATAYLAWALYGFTPPSGENGWGGPDAKKTLAYLRGHGPENIADAYVLALVANALVAIDPSAVAAGPYLDRLNALRQIDAKNGWSWWQPRATNRTLFHGAGRGGSVETTALAALALIHGKRHPEAVWAVITWLGSHRDSSGTWGSTQATVLALRAILAGTEPDRANEDRRIVLKLDGRPIDELVIASDQTEVMRQIELTRQLKPGAQRLTIEASGNRAAMFQVALRYHVPGPAPAGSHDPFLVEIKYDRPALTVGESLQATARVVSRMSSPAAMVMLELPLAAGFLPSAEEFTALVDAGTIARYQIEPRRVLVYLRDLPAGKEFILNYRLRATLAGAATASAARAYEYYDPDKQGQSATSQLTVKEKD